MSSEVQRTQPASQPANKRVINTGLRVLERIVASQSRTANHAPTLIHSRLATQPTNPKDGQAIATKPVDALHETLRRDELQCEPGNIAQPREVATVLVFHLPTAATAVPLRFIELPTPLSADVTH